MLNCFLIKFIKPIGSNVTNSFVQSLRATWRELCQRSWLEFTLFALLGMTALILVVLIPPTSLTNKTPIYLADAFLHGKVNIEAGFDAIGTNLDLSVYKEKVFWPGGPMIGIASLPLVLIAGTAANLFILQFSLNLLCLFLLYQITKALHVESSVNRCFFVLAFFTATNFSGLAMNQGGFTSYLQQVLTTAISLLSILLILRQKHAIFIGIAVACAFLTRFTLLGFIPLYPILLIKSHLSSSQKRTRLIYYNFPILIGVAMTLLYNQIRFGNWLENGYHYQILLNSSYHADMKTLGIFNFAYLPVNLYYFLLKMPSLILSKIGHSSIFPFLYADPMGMSVFITSPIMVIFFLAKTKSDMVKWLKVCSLLILLPTLFFYGIGWVQYGYRYAVDIYPLLFVIMILGIQGQPSKRWYWAAFLGLLSTWLFLF